MRRGSRTRTRPHTPAPGSAGGPGGPPRPSPPPGSPGGPGGPPGPAPAPAPAPAPGAPLSLEQKKVKFSKRHKDVAKWAKRVGVLGALAAAADYFDLGDKACEFISEKIAENVPLMEGTNICDEIAEACKFMEEKTTVPICEASSIFFSIIILIIFFSFILPIIRFLWRLGVG